ncbi:MAG: VOC family protein [Acidimicrobiia bacterium]|nr:VOC family protein [Acidimicrobiia bacterium]
MAHGDIVTHVDIPVDDMDRATSFYGTVFGWDIAEMPRQEGYPMWRGPNEISGGGFAPRDSGFQTMRNYVEVDSIDDMLAKVTESGGEVVLERTPMSDTSWYAVFQDTEGNQLGLYEGAT